MNDPQYVEAAPRAGGEDDDDGGADVQNRIAYGFRRATSRPPTKEESTILADALEVQLQRYRANPDAATKLVSIGSKPRDAEARRAGTGRVHDGGERDPELGRGRE
jgi:hypothetical protein